MEYSLHRLLRPTLALAQFCALFPVRGVLSPEPSKLRFKWCTVRILYGVVVWAGLLFTLCRTWTVVHFREPNGSLSAISNSTLMRCAVPPLVIFPLFLHLTHRWPRFVHSWRLVEDTLVVHRPNRLLYGKIYLYTVVFAAIRFVFFLETYIVTGVRVAQCVDLSSVSDFVHTLFYVRFPQVFVVTSPAHWKYLLLAFLELDSSWSSLCCNLIILDLSLVLKEKFKTFNDHLKYFEIKRSTPQFWQEMRLEYSKLSQLFAMMESLLSPLIFATVTFETMNVVLFIYLGLTHAYTMLSYVFFAIFFVSYLGVDSVTLVAMAAIFDESRKPLKVLHQVPTVRYSHEASRLYTHVRQETIALTGCKFFIVTQTAILSIVSALVTYEVLLVQLGDMRHESPEPPASESSNNSSLEYCSWIETYLKTTN